MIEQATRRVKRIHAPYCRVLTVCIPDSGLPRFADGYKAIAATLLQEKFGANYMTLLKEEMVRRMEELPKPAR
jgi:hypothetical protein